MMALRLLSLCGGESSNAIIRRSSSTMRVRELLLKHQYHRMKAIANTEIIQRSISTNSSYCRIFASSSSSSPFTTVGTTQKMRSSIGSNLSKNMDTEGAAATITNNKIVPFNLFFQQQQQSHREYHSSSLSCMSSRKHDFLDAEPSATCTKTNEQLEEFRELLYNYDKDIIDYEGYRLQKAERILLNVNYDEINNYDRPIYFFNRLLEAYSQAGEKSLMLDLLERLVTDPNLPAPEEFSFTVVLKVLPPEESFEILKGMVLERGWLCKTTFNAVIAAYCRAGNPRQAVTVLELMITSSSTAKSSETTSDDADFDNITTTPSDYTTEAPTTPIKPDKFSFTPILKVMGQMNMASDAELLLERMMDFCKVDVVAVTAVLHAIAIDRSRSNNNSDSRGQRALRIFNQMQQDWKIEPDTASYNATLLAFANEENKGPETDRLLSMMTVPANDITYTTCIQAWKNSWDLPQAVDRATELFEEFISYQHQQQQQGEQEPPNPIMHTTLVSLYAKYGLVDRAEKIAERYVGYYNDDDDEESSSHYSNDESINFIYANLLEAYANSYNVDAIDKAMDIVLTKMKTDTNNQQKIILINTALKVIEKNPSPKNFSNVQRIRHYMSKHNLHPNIRTYNSLFKACGSTTTTSEEQEDDKETIIQYVCQLVEEMKRSKAIRIDRYTYPSIFIALLRLKAPLKEIIEPLLRICIRDNAFTKIVQDKIKVITTKEQFQDLSIQYNFSQLLDTHQWRKGKRKRR